MAIPSDVRELTLLNLAGWKEAKLNVFFVAVLLRLLGYRADDVLMEHELNVVEVQHGGSRKFRAYADFLVFVDGRAFLAIESKSPDKRLCDDDVEQLFSYSRHMSVRALYCILTNGLETRLYSTEERMPIIKVSQPQWMEKFEEVARVVGRNSSTTIAGVNILEEVGRGAFGIVYKGWNPILQRFEALKVYPKAELPNRKIVARIRQGLRAQTSLNHPLIPRVHWSKWISTDFVVSMTFIHGVASNKWLERAPSLEERIEVVVAIAELVGFAHDRGITHRDLKPSNVMICEESPLKVALIDFDTAVLRDAQTLTVTGEPIGSPGFSDPAMLRKHFHRRKAREKSADIYSLGALIYYFLVGDSPPLFDDAQNARFIESALNRVKGLTPQCRSSLLYVIFHCTDKDAEVRYKDAKHLAQDLKDILSGRTFSLPDEKAVVRNIFRAFDENFVRGAITSEFKNVRHSESRMIWRAASSGKSGDYHVLYDFAYRWFMLGVFLDKKHQVKKIESVGIEEKLRSRFGETLRVEMPSQNEQGGLYVQFPLAAVSTRVPEDVAAEFCNITNDFLQIMNSGRLAASASA